MIHRLAAWSILVFVLIAALAVSGCTNGSADAGTGVLEGVVTVGPLTPVEHAGVTPVPPDPSVFTSRKILLYDAEGKTLLQEVPIQPPPAGGFQGSYRVTLEPGDYRIGYEYMGGVRFIPPVVPVLAGRTTPLDVYIDTGIR